ncbi:hypothetical protein ACHAXR_004674, partial [Thalassiosira sp. AJA248-18]
MMPSAIQRVGLLGSSSSSFISISIARSSFSRPISTYPLRTPVSGNCIPCNYGARYKFQLGYKTNRPAWAQRQNIIRCSGVLYFSSSSSSSSSTTVARATPSALLRPPSEKNTAVSCASSDNMPSMENEQSSHNCLLSSIEAQNPSIIEDTNLTKNNGISDKNGGSILFDRQIRVKRKRSQIVQINEENMVNKNSHNLNGYKYRVLRTPKLTNDLITLPVPPAESSPPIPTSPSSQMIEKENFDVQQLQQPNYANDTMREESSPTGIKDIMSSRWWRTLYQNVGNTHTTSSTNQPISQRFQSSLRSRRSSQLLEEMINNDSYTGFLPDERQNQNCEEEISERIRVRSVQAASSIDVVAVLSKVFGGGVARASQYYMKSEGDANNIKKNQHPLSDFFASSPPLRHVFGRTNIIIQLSPPPIDCLPSLSHSVPRYVVIYRFGSVVFFNLTTKEASRLLEQIKKYAIDPIAVGFERREHFEVALQPELETATGKITADRAMVRELDMNTVGIVSNIMGQTVALDWHNDTVTELLANFSSVNSTVERTGSFTSMERHTLFQVVARNNSLFIDMVGKLGIKDRSDTAWNLSQYEGLHEGMRKEFDLDERFRDIEFKLDLIQQNAKFFLEVMHAQKSNALEWVIIVLISFECVLMILDMSGWGSQMLS